MTNTRGSEWRKWDLHLHTASSYDYKYKGEDPDKKIIETLKANNIAVVAITDHFVIDKTRINNLRQIASDMSYNLVIFPGVELRTDKGGSNIHPIIIFDCNADLEILTEEFKSFRRNKAIDDENNETIRWDFKDIVTFANDNNGIITIHAGSKKNGIDEQISNVLPVKIATKKEYAQTVNILEIGKLDDINEYKTYRFPSIGVKPFIMGSDNHNPNKYPNEHNTNLFTWIKADTTFEGLKQILYEPEERVKIQATDPTLDYDKSPFTEIEILDNVKVFAKDENGNDIKDEDNIVFAKNTIPLNSGLVSIIGARGAGKSILVDYIATSIGQGSKEQSVYTKNRNVVIKHRASLFDGKEQELKLSSKSLYIPFLYISQSEIKKIVVNIQSLSTKIKQFIGIRNSYQIPLNLKSKVNHLLNDYFRIIDLLNADGTNSQQKKQLYNTEITRYQSYISRITPNNCKKILKSYKKIIETRQSYVELLRLAYNIKDNIIFLEEVVNKDIKYFNGNTINLKKTVIDEINNKAFIEKIDTQIVIIQDHINKIDKQLINIKNDKPIHYHGNWLTLLANIENYLQNIKKLTSDKNAISQSEKRLKDMTNMEIRELGEEIIKNVLKFKDDIQKALDIFVYGQNDYNEKQKKLLDCIWGRTNGVNICLSVAIHLNSDKLRNIILTLLDRQSIQELSFINGLDSFESFKEKIINKFDISTYKGNPYHLKEILNILYKRYPEFLEYNIDVSVNGKSIKKLSAGQRGTVYLRMQLAANLYSETIIIDQPEDDLDNEFITEHLVKLFKKIKKYRQVIIVSHNANLVVNADSEQVIVASNNDGVLSYKTGPLENPEINKEICKILEGGRSAFEKREQKYGFKSR